MKLLLIFAALFACVIAAPQGSFEDEGQEVGQSTEKTQFNYYLHNTPDDDESDRVVTRFITPPNLKRNKVIFVKVPPLAPKPQGPINLPAKIIEKTIVYVLVKKEKDPEQIKITTEAPKAPEPPIVHVIKYDDESDINSQIVKGVSSSRLYGKKPFTEDDVNIQLQKVKQVTDLRLISSTGTGSSDFSAADTFAQKAPSGTGSSAVSATVSETVDEADDVDY